MAKYCSKCGKVLPEGTERCPYCSGNKNEKNDAALFTMMTAETEVWKSESENVEKKKKKKRSKSFKENAGLYAVAVLLMAVTALVVWFSMPSTTVQRAVRSGNFEKALTIYTEKVAGRRNSGESAVGKSLVKKAEAINSNFESGKISADDTESAYSSLFTFGLEKTALQERYAQFQKTSTVKTILDRAEKMIANGDYLNACDLLKTVPEDSADCEAAASRADECIDLYTAYIIDRAESFMADKEYSSAIAALKTGDEKLKSYDRASIETDSLMTKCIDEYEGYALEEAGNLAGIEDYSGAVRLILTCMDVTGESSTQLDEAYDKYAALAVNKTASDSVDAAYDFYESGDVSSAFQELDAVLMRIDDDGTVESAITALEKRFSADSIKKANEALAGERDNIEDAENIIKEAVSLRRTDELEEYLENLESCRPVNLVELVYTEKDGNIYRVSDEFEAISGEKYSDGWIWGGNEAWISFDLGGEFESFEAVFAARRDDGRHAAARFELYCDGELCLSSETLSHTDKVYEINADVSGADTLKIVFYSDYETGTEAGGYCYHGLCSPVLCRELP